MAKKSKVKTPIKEQAPELRSHNFAEVCYGYTLEEGKLEAERCLQCKNAPCIANCPVMIDIPGFIHAIKEENMEKAAEIIAKYSNLPAICGRVCPQEKQCEKVCKLGQAKNFEPVAIGKLERLVADLALNQEMLSGDAREVFNETKKSKVAVIGSGPSGLTVAGDLAKKGYQVTIFEALHEAGGVLIYGIPEFRLPKEIVKKEIDSIKRLGVEIKTNVVVGKTLTLDDLFKEYDACYISVGAGTPHFLGIPGSGLKGVYASSEYLTRINLMKGYEFPKVDTPIQQAKHVAVIGGGNVAMDAARSAVRLGAEKVTVIYRRTMEELPARIEEYHHSVEEGVEYSWLTNPIEYFGDEEGNLTGIRCEKMMLGEPDESGRRRPVRIPDSEFIIEADAVIEAIGQGPNTVLLSNVPELKRNTKGYIEIDEATGQTSIEGLFAGGDIVTGAATVILAMGAGKIAAKGMDQYLQTKENE